MSVVSNVLKSPAKIVGWFSRRSLPIKIVLIVAVLGIGWFIFSSLTNEAQQPVSQTAIAQKGTIVSTVSASGNVLAANIVNVTT